MLIIIIGIVAVVLIGIGGYLWWASTQQKMVTVALPNGKTATYADTDATKKFGFKAATAGNADGSYLVLTHTDLVPFFASVDAKVLEKVCGKDGEAQKANGIVALLRTTDKTLTLPADRSCFNRLGSSDNTDTILREKATNLDNAMSSGANALLQNLTIK